MYKFSFQGVAALCVEIAPAFWLTFQLLDGGNCSAFRNSPCSTHKTVDPKKMKIYIKL
jgi:hypothetical protein